MPRYRTMRAVIHWSYSLSSEDEQRFFRALGILSGGLTARPPRPWVAEAEKTHFNSIDRLADLVSKSMVVADVTGADLRFRLLDTTRAFAIRKLAASGEHERIARAHADYYRGLFERAESEVAVRPSGSGWPTTSARSTICVQRSTGRFRLAAMDRSGRR